MSTIVPRPFASVELLREAVGQLLADTFSLEQEEPFAVMLSGGSTPLPIYEALSQVPPPVSPQLFVTFSDDRHVPIHSSESNYGNTLPMLVAMRQPPTRILYVHSDLPLEGAATKFESELKAFFEAGGQLKLALLGLGNDSHTCSLFGDTELLASQGRLAIPVTRPTPPHRVSVTPGTLERAARIAFLVAGASKREIIEQLLTEPQSTIAGRATANCAQVEIWYAL